MAKPDQQELTQEAVSRITRVVRSLADDRVERGVELGRPMHCDSCNQERPSAGSSRYRDYKLCNDCLLDFTLALASGRVENLDEFMTRPSDGGPPPPPSELSAQPERPARSLNPLGGRDKLMPSNEPC